MTGGMRPELAAVIRAALAIPEELQELARWCAHRDMPVAGHAATLRHMTDAARGLSASLRAESRLAAQALTPVTARDTPPPDPAGRIRHRLIRASQEVRWTADYLHDAHQAARAAASHDKDDSHHSDGKAPRLALSCSHLVASLEEALAAAERGPAASGTLPVLTGHLQVIESLSLCVSQLRHACGNTRDSSAAACTALPATAGKRSRELANALFHAHVTLEHTRGKVSDATHELADAISTAGKTA